MQQFLIATTFTAQPPRISRSIQTWKEGLIRIWELQTPYKATLVLPTADVLANNFLMQKAVTLNTRRIVRKFWQNSGYEVLGQ
jgi:hypothetical protein